MQEVRLNSEVIIGHLDPKPAKFFAKKFPKHTRGIMKKLYIPLMTILDA